MKGMHGPQYSTCAIGMIAMLRFTLSILDMTNAKHAEESTLVFVGVDLSTSAKSLPSIGDVPDVFATSFLTG